MKRFKISFQALALLITLKVSGQTIINNYAKVVNIPSCNPCVGNCDELIVDDASNFSVGDVILIIQVKGAQVKLAADPTFGDILDYGAAGFHEKNTINAIVGNTIYLTSGTAGAYDAGSSLQIVSVPQYGAGYTVPAGGLTCPAWDGNTGGVIALDVVGTLSLSGDVDARGKGLRGAQNPNTNDNEVFCAMKNKGDYFFDLADIQVAGRKGEGIAEWILPSYELGRGKWANGGGGGHNHNAGGGGGSNMGAGGLGGDEYGGLNCSSVTIRNGIGGQALDYQGGLRLFLGGGGGGGQENNNRGNSGGDGGGIIFISADNIEGNGFWIRADGNKGINWAGVQDGPGGNDGGGGGGAGGSIKLKVTSYGTTPLTVSAEGADGGDLTANIHGPGGGGGGGLICSSVNTFPSNVTVDVTGGQGGTTGNGSNWGTQPGEDGIINSGCTPPTVPPLSFSVNLGSDAKLCSPPEHTFDSRLDATNNFVWYKDGTVLNGETGPTLTVNGPGTYVVETGAVGCPTVYDTVEVTSDAASPTNVDFCGTNQSIALGITGPGAYAWYDAPTGGNKIGSGPTFNTPLISADATYYVEDTTVFKFVVGEPASGHGLSGGNGAAGGTQMYMEFEAFDEFTIDAITFAFKAWWLGATDRFDVTVTIVDNNNNPVGSMTNNNINPGRTGSIPGPNIVYTRVPIGINIPATGNYKIQVTSTTQIHWFQNGRQLPYTDPTGEVIRIWSTHPDYMPFFDWKGDLVPASYAPNSLPGFFDWEISAGLACDRVPVNANYDCPATCTSPSITPSVSPSVLNICGAINDTLISSLEAGFYYQWYLDGNPITGANGIEDTSYIASQVGNYTVRVVDDISNLADNSCYQESAPVSITSTPISSPTITLSPDNNNVCEGTPISFTTVVTNEGTSPTYKWYINNADIGITASSISTDTLSNGSIVKATIVSNVACAQPDSAYDEVTIQLSPILNPNLDMIPDQNGVCPGEMITFNIANVSDSGSTPTYLWTINGNNVGNGSSINTDTLSDGALVTVTMTPSETCSSPLSISKDVTINLGTSIIPTVSITLDKDSICAGEMVSFSISDSSGGGNDPVFSWMINGQNILGDFNSISTDTLSVNTTVNVTMTSSSTCASPSAASTNEQVIVTPILSPSINLTADTNNVCEGTMINFSTTASNEGNNPIYSWEINGTTIASATRTISTDTLSNGSTIQVTLTSDMLCATPNTSSSQVTSTFLPTVIPSISITHDMDTICSNDGITFTITDSSYGGNNPVFSWDINGTIVAGDVTSIYIDTLSSNPLLEVSMVSSLACPNQPTTTTFDSIMVLPTITPSVVISPDNNNICEGTMITFSITDSSGANHANYSWSINNTQVASGNSPSIQTDTLSRPSVISVIMNTNNQCSSPVNVSSDTLINVTPQTTPSISINASTTNICFGDPIDLIISSQSNEGTSPSYTWTQYDATNGTYSIIGNGTSFTSSTFDNLDSIFVTLTSNALCTSPSTVSSNVIVLNVANNVSPQVSINTLPPLCFGDSATFIATPSFGGTSPSFQWYTVDVSHSSTPQLIGIDSSIYIDNGQFENGDSIFVIMTSNAGCIDPLISPITTSNKSILTINDIPKAPTNLLGDLTLCAGTIGNYSVSPIVDATNYEWILPNGAVIASGSNSINISIDFGSLLGQQTIFIAGQNSCGLGPLDSVSTDIINVTQPSVSINSNNSSGCTNDLLSFYVDQQLHAGPNPLYEWHKSNPQGDQIVSSQSADSTFSSTQLSDNDSIYVILLSNQQCANPTTASSNKIKATIIAAPTPSISLISSSNTICIGEAITLTSTEIDAGTAPILQLYINSTSIPFTSPLILDTLTASSTISLTMNSSLSCWTGGIVNSNILNINVFDTPSPLIVGPNTLCNKQKATLSLDKNYPGGEITWYKGNQKQSTEPNLDVNTNGNYHAEVKNTGGCSASSPIHNINVVTPFINAGDDQTINLGDDITLNASGNVSSYSWNNKDILSDAFTPTPTASPIKNTTFIITGELNNCQTQDSVLISVLEPIVIPNVFSPNGDNLNDTWKISGLSSYPKFILHVYNRWGDKVYAKYSNYEPWDGKKDGTDIPVAVYYYILYREFGDQAPMNGSVTILK